MNDKKETDIIYGGMSHKTEFKLNWIFLILFKGWKLRTDGWGDTYLCKRIKK